MTDNNKGIEAFNDGFRAYIAKNEDGILDYSLYHFTPHQLKLILAALQNAPEVVTPKKFENMCYQHACDTGDQSIEAIAVAQEAGKPLAYRLIQENPFLNISKY